MRNGLETWSRNMVLFTFLSPGAVTVVLEMPLSVENSYRQVLSIPWNSLFIKISDVSFFYFILCSEIVFWIPKPWDHRLD